MRKSAEPHHELACEGDVGRSYLLLDSLCEYKLLSEHIAITQRVSLRSGLLYDFLYSAFANESLSSICATSRVVKHCDGSYVQSSNKLFRTDMMYLVSEALC